MKKTILVLMIILLLQPSYFIKPAYALKNELQETLKKTCGVISGITISPIIGMVRGFTKGLILGADLTSSVLGEKDSSTCRMIGYTTGGIVVGTGGLFAGLLMGAYEGVKYGLEEPLSKENFSLGGLSFTDYDLI